MKIPVYVKLITAIFLLVIAFGIGLYFSGWLATLLLGQYHVKPQWDTWWRYWHAINLPHTAPSAALKVKIAGGLGFGLPAILWLALAYLLMRGQKISSLHGNARFATAGDLKKAGLLGAAPNGIVVGKWGNQLIRLAGQQFVILAAPTRSGKGVGVVIPNLLEYQESVVVLDIKQENFDLTSGWRQSQGQEIYLFNPFAEDRRTHRWNPLSYVSQDPDFRISDIQGIAAMLYPAVDDKQKFWISHARNAFTAFALYLFESADHRRSQALASSVAASPTLGAIYRLSTGEGGDLKEYLQGLAQQPFLSPNARAAFANLLSQEKETFASIIGSFKEPLNAWLNPVLDAATSGDDFDLSAVRKKKMTIYLGIQPGKLAESRLIVNLFFSQLIDVNTRELPQNNPALKHQCLLLMDEFTSIGRVDILAQAVAYMAGYNLRLLPIIQSMAQLDAVYGRELARTLITNHALQILYAPREQQDANDYSEMLGYTTVRKESRTRSQGKGREISRSEHEERRALMLPQELKALGADKEVFLYEGIPHPVKCDKIRYYQDKRFTKRIMPKVDVKPLGSGKTDAGTPPQAQPRQRQQSVQRQLEEPEPQRHPRPSKPPPLQPPAGSQPPPQEMWNGKPLPPYTYIRKKTPPSKPTPPVIDPPLWRWRPPKPANAPQPDYGDFWERYPPPPEGLISPMSEEAPIEALLYGPHVRRIMGRWAIDEYLPEEGAHLSNLVPVHRTTYNHFYEKDLLRQGKLANKRTEEEYGQKPIYQPPPPPRRKPDLSRFNKSKNSPNARTPDGMPADPVFNRVAEQQEQENEDMNLKQATAMAALAVTMTTACTPGADEPRQLQESEYKSNPAPQQRYELMMEIKNAPGPFGFIGASAYYIARNCHYYIPTLVPHDVFNWPRATKTIEMVQVSDTQWKGIFHTDGMLDQDDGSGKRTCHWEMDDTSLAVYLTASGAREDTLFQASLSEKDLHAEKSVKFYFNRHWYPGNPNDPTASGDVYSGDTDRSRLGPILTDADLFTITLSVRKLAS